ncbi:hypothetical protein ALC53_11052 [Atta colombica]|uniref:Uncharacterized protein n=1 Tax=Atta colombica TaxID=520822 RepID=A0A195B280_9HYME|nr:hypothetical protein ALC53_11052 [Atta colombica]
MRSSYGFLAGSRRSRRGAPERWPLLHAFLTEGPLCILK